MQSGHEYTFAKRPSLLTLFSFGFYVRPWLRLPDPATPPAVGRFSADGFDPRTWVANYPKAAYDNMRADDAFWAARIVARFSDEAIRAIVRSGRYSDPAAVELLADALIKRRDRIKEVWLTGINPIVNATLSPDGRAPFRERGGLHDVGGRPDGYALRWSRFDNATDTHTPVGDEVVVTDTRALAPAGVLEGSDYVSVRIDTRHPALSHLGARAGLLPPHGRGLADRRARSRPGREGDVSAPHELKSRHGGRAIAARRSAESMRDERPLDPRDSSSRSSISMRAQEPVTPPEPQPDQKADAKEPPTPAHTGLRALFGNLGEDITRLPAMQNLYIAAIGGALAAAVHPADDTFNQRLQSHYTARPLRRSRRASMWATRPSRSRCPSARMWSDAGAISRRWRIWGWTCCRRRF